MNKNTKRITILSQISIYALYFFIIVISLSPLFKYIFNIGYLHLIILIFLFIILVLRFLHKEKIIINRLIVPICIYICITAIGSVAKSFNIVFIMRVLSYRIMYPVLFIMFFSLENNIKQLKNIGYNLVKVTNVACLVLGVVGIIEKYNPSIVYKFYGDNLTPHLTLILNGEKTTRLLSLAGNPINLGFYMAIGISSAVILILTNWKNSNFLVGTEILCTIIFIYVLFFTYSRSAILVAFVIIIVITVLFTRQINLKNKRLIVFFILSIFVLIVGTLLSIDSIATRLKTMNPKSYFNNSRFLNAYNAFDKKTNIIQYILGHGINKSNAYVFELGYASLLYESGIIGTITFIVSFLKGIFFGVTRIDRKINTRSLLYINFFYIAIIFSGLVGMFVQDLYMQQPYSVYLWFSSIFLTTNVNTCFGKKSNYKIK